MEEPDMNDSIEDEILDYEYYDSDKSIIDANEDLLLETESECSQIEVIVDESDDEDKFNIESLTKILKPSIKFVKKKRKPWEQKYGYWKSIILRIQSNDKLFYPMRNQKISWSQNVSDGHECSNYETENWEDYMNDDIKPKIPNKLELKKICVVIDNQDNYDKKSVLKVENCDLQEKTSSGSNGDVSSVSTNALTERYSDADSIIIKPNIEQMSPKLSPNFPLNTLSECDFIGKYSKNENISFELTTEQSSNYSSDTNINFLELFQTMCHRYFIAKSCTKKDCQLLHVLPNNFKQALLELDIDTLLKTYQWVKGTSLFNLTFTIFVQCLVRLNRLHDIVNMIPDIFIENCYKVQRVKDVVNGLQNLELNFQEAINFIVLMHGINKLELSDCLLYIISEHPDINKNIVLIEKLTNYRTQELSSFVVNNLISLCLSRYPPDMNLCKQLNQCLFERNIVNVEKIPSVFFNNFNQLIL